MPVPNPTPVIAFVGLCPCGRTALWQSAQQANGVTSTVVLNCGCTITMDPADVPTTGAAS